jgi:hypothetical protein
MTSQLNKEMLASIFDSDIENNTLDQYKQSLMIVKEAKISYRQNYESNRE